MSILIKRLTEELDAAIVGERDKSYERLAREFGVSRSTVTKRAKQIQLQTGFQRRPRKTKATRASGAVQVDTIQSVDR